MEERAALQLGPLREELAASRLYLLAEQDRRIAAETRLLATAEQEMLALRAQVFSETVQDLDAG